MDIYRMEREAQDRGFDSAEFFLSAPKGVFPAKWRDAYFGMFEIPDLTGDGFIMSKQLPKGFEVFWTREEAEEHNAPFAAIREAIPGIFDLQKEASE
jgi:hypothetical protein